MDVGVCRLWRLQILERERVGEVRGGPMRDTKAVVF